jgi:hypothetical protein
MKTANAFVANRHKFKKPKNLIKIHRHIEHTRTKAIGQSRAVDFLNEIRDFECVHLAALGYSDEVIMRETGLSKGQIAYRLKRVELKRSYYRRGESEIGKLVISKTKEAVSQKLTRNFQIFESGETVKWTLPKSKQKQHLLT